MLDIFDYWWDQHTKFEKVTIQRLFKTKFSFIPSSGSEDFQRFPLPLHQLGRFRNVIKLWLNYMWWIVIGEVCCNVCDWWSLLWCLWLVKSFAMFVKYVAVFVIVEAVTVVVIGEVYAMFLIGEPLLQCLWLVKSVSMFVTGEGWKTKSCIKSHVVYIA